MTVLAIQRRLRQVGRIRIGVQAPTASGKNAPKKIDTFRLTSPDRRIIEAAAGLYGGTVEAWSREAANEWQVTTTATELAIALPPDMALSQTRETWSRGGCTKRCDGQWDAKRGVACDCDPDAPECKLTTRLNVLLPEVPGLGLWRLDSHGYFAAVELAGAVELVQQMAGRGVVIPARLRLEQRELRRIIDGKATTQRFGVPVIDIDVSIMGVRSLATRVGDVDVTGGEPMQLPAGAHPVAPPAPPAALSVLAQVEDATKATPTKKRANSAAPLPGTGRDRRAGPTVDAQTCHRCGQPYGAEALVRNPDGEGSKFVHKACGPPEATTGEASDGAPAGGGGAAGEDASALADPTPTSARTVVANAQRATAKQRGKLMALIAETFPVDVAQVTGPEADAMRRNVTIAMCAALGLPGISSRADIDHATASLLINALEEMKIGTVGWDDQAERFVDKATGEVIERAKP